MIVSRHPMTAKQQAALDYYDAAHKRAHRDPELKRALDLVILTIRTWTNAGWESSVDGACFASIRWFYLWDSQGREGGLDRFRNGLKMSMRIANHKVVPKTDRVVQGVDSDGQPHFDKSMGPFQLLAEDAGELVRVWNLEHKEIGSKYRFRRTSHSRLTKAFPGLKMRRIIRYEIEIRERKMFSLDQHEEARGHGRSSLWSDQEQYSWEDAA